MPKGTEGAPALTQASAQAPVQDKLDLILGAINGVRGTVEALDRRLSMVEDKVRQQDLRVAKFQPMQEAVAGKAPKPNLKVLTAAEQMTGDGTTLPVSADGRIVSYMSPPYAQGTMVRINPQSDLYQRLKASQSRYKVDPDELEGRVVGTHFINRDLRWKYRVYFPGLTQPRGDGFWDEDLMPA